MSSVVRVWRAKPLQKTLLSGLLLERSSLTTSGCGDGARARGNAHDDDRGNEHGYGVELERGRSPTQDSRRGHPLPASHEFGHRPNPPPSLRIRGGH